MAHLSSTARTLALAAVASAAVVGIGVLVATPQSPARAPLTTTLASLDTTSMVVPRAPFCDRVRRSDVTAALGATPTDATSWANGDTFTEGGVEDVAHEYGCRWEAGTGAVSAWVFAPPVTEARAQTLVQSAAAGTDGCAALPGAAAFGAPTLAQQCPSTTAGRTVISFRGLFGDAWVVCQRDAADDPGLTDRWCAAVAQAVSDHD